MRADGWIERFVEGGCLTGAGIVLRRQTSHGSTRGLGTCGARLCGRRPRSRHFAANAGKIQVGVTGIFAEPLVGGAPLVKGHDLARRGHGRECRNRMFRSGRKAAPAKEQAGDKAGHYTYEFAHISETKIRKFRQISRPGTINYGIPVLGAGRPDAAIRPIPQRAGVCFLQLSPANAEQRRGERFRSCPAKRRKTSEGTRRTTDSRHLRLCRVGKRRQSDYRARYAFVSAVSLVAPHASSRPPCVQRIFFCNPQIREGITEGYRPTGSPSLSGAAAR